MPGQPYTNANAWRRGRDDHAWRPGRLPATRLVLEAGLGQAANIDEGATGQPDVCRDRQRIVQFGRLGPDHPASHRIAGPRILRTRATDLKPAQVVAAQEEPVDDLLLLPFVPQVAETPRHCDAPI